jgi:hypothetical protein
MLHQQSSFFSVRSMTKGLLAGLLFAGVLSTTSAQTSDFVREKILKNVTAACQERQLEVKPVGATPQMIEKFCICNATYLADNLTDEQVFKFQDNTPPGPPVAMLQVANKSCAAALK